MSSSFHRCVARIRFRPVPFSVSYKLSSGLIDGEKRDDANNSILFLACWHITRFCTEVYYRAGIIAGLISKCSPLSNANRY